MPVNPRARAIETVGRIARIRGAREVDKAFAPTERAWHFVDAYGLVLGRLASRIAPLLCGKHKPTYSPVQDMGDYVVVTNAAKVVYTGKKVEQKVYYRHSGRPGGLTTTTLKDLILKNPVEPLRRAVLGMLPKNKLRAQRMRRLRLFPDEQHTHDAQQQLGSLAFNAVFRRDHDGPPKLEPIRETRKSE
uniref:50S ribosomal protein L13 n=1 Tax=Coccolithus braarudii TaxID=221442 RepID=A0A7S0LQX6_9EUKA|mmetsp:Transcript_51914/g.110945  ORF Transcript_51914/g.110945 Transcript_51914/m.110945 type:complete len:189 (+) Transcript_51914:94-660(+)